MGKKLFLNIAASILALQASVALANNVHADALNRMKTLEESEQLAYVLREFQNKMVTDPTKLSEWWLHIRAAMLRLMAAEIEQDQKDTSPALNEIARNALKLSGMLYSLPMAKQTTSLGHGKFLKDWFAIKAEEAALAAKQFKALAKQTSNEKVVNALHELARQWHNQSMVITQALALSETSSQ